MPEDTMMPPAYSLTTEQVAILQQLAKCISRGLNNDSRASAAFLSDSSREAVHTVTVTASPDVVGKPASGEYEFTLQLLYPDTLL